MGCRSQVLVEAALTVPRQTNPPPAGSPAGESSGEPCEPVAHVVDGAFGPVAVPGEDVLEVVTGAGQAGQGPGQGVAGEQMPLAVEIQDASPAIENSIQAISQSVAEAALDQGPSLDAMRRAVAAMVAVGDRLMFVFGDPRTLKGYGAPDGAIPSSTSSSEDRPKARSTPGSALSGSSMSSGSLSTAHAKTRIEASSPGTASPQPSSEPWKTASMSGNAIRQPHLPSVRRRAVAVATVAD